MNVRGPGETVRPLFRALALPASGMSAQRRRLDAIAANIANAQTTRTPDGGPYRRQIVELQAAQPMANGSMTAQAMSVGPELPLTAIAATEPGPGGVEVSGVYEDQSAGAIVYDPGHPDADVAGYVRYPNVRMEEEMIALMEARRAYEANATVFQAMKGLLRRALEI